MHRISDSRPDAATLRGAHTLADTATSDTRPGGGDRVRLNSAYVTPVDNAGLVPLIVPPLSTPVLARSIRSAGDGLVLTGGEDVDPTLYGHAPHDHLGTVNRRRDETEIALVHAAREMRKPVLAI